MNALSDVILQVLKWSVGGGKFSLGLIGYRRQPIHIHFSNYLTVLAVENLAKNFITLFYSVSVSEKNHVRTAADEC